MYKMSNDLFARISPLPSPTLTSAAGKKLMQKTNG